MGQNNFQKLVEEAVSEMPENIRQKMDNVAICVEKRPSPEQLRKLGERHRGILLGLYEGVPQTKWGRGFGMRLPDKITIFQESIERLARTSGEIKKNVKRVVYHEIAHHFGFDEKGVRDLERKGRRNPA